MAGTRKQRWWPSTSVEATWQQGLQQRPASSAWSQRCWKQVQPKRRERRTTKSIWYGWTDWKDRRLDEESGEQACQPDKHQDRHQLRHGQVHHQRYETVPFKKQQSWSSIRQGSDRFKWNGPKNPERKNGQHLGQHDEDERERRPSAASARKTSGAKASWACSYCRRWLRTGS